METFPRGGDEALTLACILTLDEDTVGDTFKKLDVYMQSEHVSDQISFQYVQARPETGVGHGRRAV